MSEIQVAETSRAEQQFTVHRLNKKVEPSPQNCQLISS